MFAVLFRPGWKEERREQNDIAHGRLQLLCTSQAKPASLAAGGCSLFSLLRGAFPCLDFYFISFSRPLQYSSVCKKEQHHPAPSNIITCSASAFRILLLLLFTALCWRGTAYPIPEGCELCLGISMEQKVPLRISSLIGL